MLSIRLSRDVSCIRGFRLTCITKTNIPHLNLLSRNLWQNRALQVSGMASVRGKTTAIPRLSACLIVINEKNEVLMVQRHLESSTFAGACVFPGGGYDEIQDSSLEMTAIRETFEEAGILLASRVRLGQPEITESEYDEARKKIHTDKLLFTKFLSDNGLVADTESLLPFSTWVTPPTMPRRFRAQFFVTFLPVASAVAGPSSGTHIYRLPSPDAPDNETSLSTEVVSAFFIHPREALAAFDRGEIALMPPQFYMLTTLKDIFGSGADADRNTPAQCEEVARVASSVFGRMEFNPRPLYGLSRPSPDGTQVLALEGDEERGGKAGHLHRTIFYPQKGSALPRKLELKRNLDITKDLEDIEPQSKL